MQAVITSQKHFVQSSLAAIASGAIASILQISAVAVANKDADQEVEEGSIVKAIYCEYWVTSDDTAQGSSVWILEKIPAGAASATAADMADLNSYVNKKNILHTGMGLIGPNTQPPFNLVKGWFKIPKGKQRMGLGDKLKFTILGQSNGMSFCGFSLYKEYT